MEHVSITREAAHTLAHVLASGGLPAGAYAPGLDDLVKKGLVERVKGAAGLGYFATAAGCLVHNEVELAADPSIPPHRHIGVSPTGVTWNVFPKKGDTPEGFAERVEIATGRLAKLHAKAGMDLVKVSKLAPNGVWLISDASNYFEGELGEDVEAATFGATYVAATRRLLSAVLEELEVRLDDYGESAAHGGAETPEQANFAERTARRSVLVTMARIRYALEGKKQPRKVYVPRADTEPRS